MTPGFSVGGVVVCERVPVSSLAVRDVIVFREPARPSTQVIHRIVKLTDNAAGPALINTQGDANPAQDPWTLTIKGNDAYVARWSLPLIGYAAIFYQNHRAEALLGAGIVALAVAASFALGDHGPSKGRREAPSDSPEQGAAPVTKSPGEGEPETDPEEPETDRGEPETDPGEPETGPGEPETGPEEPETDRGEPETDPGEPETDRGEPETDPGEPETEIPPERGGTGHKKWSSQGSRRG